MDKIARKNRAEAFTALHRKGDPVMLFNVWDAASADMPMRKRARAASSCRAFSIRR